MFGVWCLVVKIRGPFYLSGMQPYWHYRPFCIDGMQPYWRVAQSRVDLPGAPLSSVPTLSPVCLCLTCVYSVQFVQYTVCIVYSLYSVQFVQYTVSTVYSTVCTVHLYSLEGHKLVFKARINSCSSYFDIIPFFIFFFTTAAVFWLFLDLYLFLLGTTCAISKNITSKSRHYYSVQRGLYTANCTVRLYTVNCTVRTVQCKLYTENLIV